MIYSLEAAAIFDSQAISFDLPRGPVAGGTRDRNAHSGRLLSDFNGEPRGEAAPRYPDSARHLSASFIMVGLRH